MTAGGRGKRFPAARIFFVLVLAFSLFNPASGFSETKSRDNELDVFTIVPSGRSLLTSPQFLLVDDFNSGKFLNRRGAPWQTKAQTGALDLTLDKDDARSQHHGYSMRADFHLMPGEQAVFQSFLDRIDVSKASALVLKVKLDSKKEKNFSGRFRLALTDWRKKTVIQDVTPFFPKNEEGWCNVQIPMSRFRLLDLDQLFSIAFQIKAGPQQIAGSVWVDEIAFFGYNDVAFESLRDNLAGFPRILYDVNRRNQLQKMKDDAMLLEIARDTWKYFINARDKDTSLIVDHIRTGDSSLAADYTSPTNIAMDLMAIISASDLGFITKDEAEQAILKVFATLREMRRYKGFFYNYYDTKKLAVTREYISSVDSGWLAIAMVLVRQTFEGNLARQATKFLEAFSFQDFLDSETNQLIIGFDVPPKPDKDLNHYGLLISEARATSYLAIGKGDVPAQHWFDLFRTPPEAWKWQTQKPKGSIQKSPDGLDYFQGYYEYQGKKFVPSWGGSLFEFLMPTLVLKERELAPEGLGLNDKTATEIQRDYALKEKKYPVWGISPASTSNGRRWTYQEYGVRALGAKGYPDQGVITPHVTFLALDSLPKDAVKNIRELLKLNLYGEYGLYDSYNVIQNKPNPQYLALDQGMTLAALDNYLKKGALQNRFHKDEIGKRAEKLMKESFFKGPAVPEKSR